MKRPCVCVLASARNGTLHVGVTADVMERIQEHRAGRVAGFARRYGVRRLVYLEFHATMDAAIRHGARPATAPVALARRGSLS